MHVAVCDSQYIVKGGMKKGNGLLTTAAELALNAESNEQAWNRVGDATHIA
jgi:hypothetical protein